ncbi:hypothetical protein [Lysinibacillus sphaericus]|uniref:hypothetical protein n=1 Tax=Lysinibacillus TaxID=400634 RepID=UPI00055E1EB9|nr:hypothetical protein [Lysinibacillus sphaericus]
MLFCTVHDNISDKYSILELERLMHPVELSITSSELSGVELGLPERDNTLAEQYGTLPER